MLQKDLHFFWSAFELVMTSGWQGIHPWDGIPEYEETKIAIRAIVPVNDPMFLSFFF